jgi:predicted nucleic acid-binding protein
LVAYYCPEVGSAAAQRAVMAAEEPAVSALAEVEFASALSAKVRARALAPAAVTRISQELRADVARGVFAPLSLARDHFDRAETWLSTWKPRLRALDAPHLAVAMGAGATLLTADREQVAAARKLGIALAPPARS